jgi:hypothetical protein
MSSCEPKITKSVISRHTVAHTHTLYFILYNKKERKRIREGIYHSGGTHVAVARKHPQQLAALGHNVLFIPYTRVAHIANCKSTGTKRKKERAVLEESRAFII